MKIRHDFVTNSSSSSFIITNNSNETKTTEIQEGLMLFAKWYQHLWW